MAEQQQAAEQQMAAEQQQAMTQQATQQAVAKQQAQSVAENLKAPDSIVGKPPATKRTNPGKKSGGKGVTIRIGK